MPQNVRLKFRDKPRAGENTTIAVIATDAVMTKAGAKRLAISAHDGFARAIWPAHTPVDGDLVFALATGRSGITLELDDAIDLYAAAAPRWRAPSRARSIPPRRRPATSSRHGAIVHAAEGFVALFLASLWFARPAR